MKEFGVCGTLCNDCSLFQRECKGCLKEMADSSYRCDVYACAMEKGINSCKACPEDMNTCVISIEHRNFCPLIVSKTNRFDLGL